MEIGTGAPTPEELARVRHHFVGHLEPSEEMSAGRFQQEARAVIERLARQGKVPVVVGGSGLYIQALIDGLFGGPGKSEAIRERLQEEAAESGAAPLYERLRSVDPAYAETIESVDLRRVVRALEVYEMTGSPLSQLHREAQDSRPLDALQVGIAFPRQGLYARINARVDAMMEAGFVGEVERLIEAGYREHLQRLKSLGYREVMAYLKGEMTLGEAVEAMKQNTRRYAKRQLTWFRGDTRVRWLDVAQYETDTSRVERILEWRSEK